MVVPDLASSFHANVSFDEPRQRCLTDGSVVCQLHGGDIGVSSKEGEGSTFGFFFKVRRSDGSSDNGRPPRPVYSRANSNLTQIKERSNERPSAKTLTSHNGVDLDAVDDCLRNPPTEHMPESHPESFEDQRYKETEEIAKNVQPERSAVTESIEEDLPKLDHGETERQEGVASDTSRSQSNQRADEKQTLLLVEDNLINQKVLRRQLQTRGFEVFVANNGQEAIDAVAQRGKVPVDDPNDRNYFDIILMDQEMPIKDGNQATQEIRQLQEQGKAGYSHIIGVSANVREAQTQSMRDAGMDDIISKPFKVEDLVKRIKSIILEDGPVAKEKESHPPATNISDNKEVRMLEDVPIRSRSEISGKGEKEMETGGKARIELNGEEQKGNENRAESEGRKKAREQSQEREEERDRRKMAKDRSQEREEERDRREGKEGKQSGREGEARGGERSRSRQAR
jgi:CheY-like chemotaxis protein